MGEFSYYIIGCSIWLLVLILFIYRAEIKTYITRLKKSKKKSNEKPITIIKTPKKKNQKPKNVKVVFDDPQNLIDLTEAEIYDMTVSVNDLRFGKTEMNIKDNKTFSNVINISNIKPY